MTNAQRLVAEIRHELDPVEQEIRRHPYLAALEAGHVRREDLAYFAGEQHQPLRSHAERVVLPDGARQRDGGAGGARGLRGRHRDDDAQLQAYEPAPGAHAYTANYLPRTRRELG